MYRQSCHNQKRWSHSGHFLRSFGIKHLFSCKNLFFFFFFLLKDRLRRAGLKHQFCQALRWNLPPHDGPHRENTPHASAFISIILLCTFLSLHFSFPLFLRHATKNVTSVVAVLSIFSHLLQKKGTQRTLSHAIGRPSDHPSTRLRIVYILWLPLAANL